MNDLIRQTTIAGLLHDIGKVLHRGISVDGRAHSISGYDFLKEFIKEEAILEAVRYHHYQDLSLSKIDDSSLAYIIYLADNISSGADRRKIEGGEISGFDRNRTLESVYNLLNNSNRKDAYNVSSIGNKIMYPDKIDNYAAGDDYNRLIFSLREGLRGIDFSSEYINSLIEICEAYLSYIPSSTYLKEVSDISLFDHSKLTAAFAVNILLYLNENKRKDHKTELFLNSASFYNEKAFQIFSCDISGIQQFIYNISSKRALKSLRSRSFYLEILLENLIDEILSFNHLYRTNIIYTGGGHAYLLLPNINTVKKNIQTAIDSANYKLMELFKD
ncbi:MAG: type III-A CRISPR-associated protein Cas10/Csm1 [Clostridiales bacterium]|nr:type III-A CRISPR-associated protein Cas10/Csm1 [Clostridiales bacterium]